MGDVTPYMRLERRHGPPAADSGAGPGEGGAAGAQGGGLAPSLSGGLHHLARSGHHQHHLHGGASAGLGHGPSLNHGSGHSQPSRMQRMQSTYRITRGRWQRHRSWMVPLLLLAAASVGLFVYSVHSGTASGDAAGAALNPDMVGASGGAARIPWASVAAQRRAALQDRLRAPRWDAAALDGYLQRALTGPYPIRLKYPVLWCGALFSRSGYGTEAVSYVAALLQLGLVSPQDVWVSQSGDHLHEEVVAAMDPGLVRLLQDHHYHNMSARLPPEDASRPLISVCHSFPDCWRTPRDDDPWRQALKRVGHFFKYTVMHKKWRDNGCPCPHADIKDQVVYRVGRTMFETERLPQPLAAYSQHMDEVWVPSEFNRRSFAAGGVDATKLFVLFQGINTTLFNPGTQLPVDLAQLGGTLVAGAPGLKASGCDDKPFRNRRISASQPSVIDSLFNVAPDEGPGRSDGSGTRAQQRGPQRRSQAPFRFLSVFKWEARKGWDMLLRAYVDAFRGETDVELHIVTKEAFVKVKDFPSYFRRIAGPLLGARTDADWAGLPRIVLHHRHIPDAEYPRVYAAMDALVIPTHGEGWGRPQIEAMAMGLPVISTNWSGLTAFMDDSVAYPIKVAAVVPVQDDGPDAFEWFVGQRWAQPDEGHLKQLMRQVFGDRVAAARKGDAARRRVLAQFSDFVVAQRLLAHLLRIQDAVDDLLWGSSASLGAGAGVQGASGVTGRRVVSKENLTAGWWRRLTRHGG